MTDTTPRRPYRTDLSDARWALIEPTLTAWRAERAARGLGINPATVDLREIVNAMIYLNRAGCPWDLLPHDFPAWQTVYSYFADWRDDGIFKQLNLELVTLARRTAGRADGPTLAILDSQSVKTSTNVLTSDQGIDPNKKIVGRKRHIAVDILGLLIGVLTTAANKADSYGGMKILNAVHAGYPTVSTALADGGFNAAVVRHASALGIDLKVVPRNTQVKGFVVVKTRWIVERTLGWIMQHRRLVRDYEQRPDSSSSMIRIAMIDNMLRRITHETTQTWRYPVTQAIVA